MFDAIKKMFRGSSLAELEAVVDRVNELEPAIAGLSDVELSAESEKLRAKISAGEPLEDHLERAFALAREAAKRTLGQRPYNVQIMGGIVLHRGAVAEMMTGEGKTLTAVLPVYLNALTGKGVHVVTVNEYLARRDAVWMGQIYRMLGVSVACLVPGQAFLYDPEWHVPPEAEQVLDRARDLTGSFLVQQEFLRPVSRREAYRADVTYGTNHEFGFDYLRDNLAYSLEQQAQREHHFAIIDEVDSILIDEARTPLIIAAPDAQSSEAYKTFARVATHLNRDEDFEVDEKKRTVSINDTGIEKVERMVGIQNIYAPEHLRLVHYLEESLRAKALFQRDKDYVVKDGQIIIVDEFTGRMLHGRRYQGGLHQAIEAKEGVLVKEESRTYAKISIQNYFRMYDRISGMTGTAQTSAEEFWKVYELEVVSIPPNRPLIREDRTDVIYQTAAAKWRAVVRDIQEHFAAGQPVLVGTTSIEKNEHLSALLAQAGVPHEVLNAKNNEREGSIIAQAGRLKSVTVATNVAGRGVDVILGGNPPKPEDAAKVRELGGLYVIGTERHEARRIDNQLRGRSGRQGDPGKSQFYLSLEDDLVRIFGGDRVKSFMERFDVPADEPLQVKMVANAVAQAQSKVEGAHFDIRKHLLDYDDVLNKQRGAVYKRRRDLLQSLDPEKLAGVVRQAAEEYLGMLMPEDAPPHAVPPSEDLKKMFGEAGITTKERQLPEQPTPEDYRALIAARSEEAAQDGQTLNRLLQMLDLLWMTHLENLDALQESVGLRAYGQRDPLVEYRHEAHRLYKEFWANWNAWVFMNVFKLAGMKSAGGAGQQSKSVVPQRPKEVVKDADGKKVGRNDPCPCGSGKKYKKCHGK